MKKRFALILAAVLILALLAGCGASATMDSAAVATPAAAPAEYKLKSQSGYGGYYDSDYAYAEEEYAYEAPAAEAPVPAPTAITANGTTVSSIPNGVKLIYQGNISLESTQFDDAVDAVRALTQQCGGYYESSSLDNYSSYRYAYYTIRVPAEQFEVFCSAVSEISAGGETFRMTSISRSAEDVSEYYYDTESRLTTQQTKLARLQELLAKAENMEDIITIESAISDTELQIENLTGTLRHYDSLVGYSTLYVNISEVYKLTEIEEPAIGFGAKLSAAFQQGCSNFVNDLERAALRFARGWIGWLIFLVIVVIVVLVAVRCARRRRAKKAALREEKEARLSAKAEAGEKTKE